MKPEKPKWSVFIMFQHIILGGAGGGIIAYMLGLDRINEYLPLFVIAYGVVSGSAHDTFSFLRQVFAFKEKIKKDDSK